MYDIYQTTLKERIKEVISDWSGNKPPMEKTVHRFFRSLKGTAGTLGMTGIAETAERLMGLYAGNVPDRLADEEVQALISQLRLLLTEDAYEPVRTDPSERMEGQVFVLLIDADLEFANSIKEILGAQNIHVVVALTARKGLDLFYTIRPDFVMLSLDLPDMDGFIVLEKLAARSRKNFTPIAALAANPQKTDKIRAYELGATDFIKKLIDPAIFLPYLYNRLAYRSEIQRMVIMDDLTGAYNRRYLTNVVPEYITAYQDRRTASAFVLLDLDNFKQVNDTYGHAAGDTVLREFAKCVKSLIREQDGLFRFGGEEFALLLPSTTKEAAREIVLRIRTAFANYRFTVGTDTFSVTFSAGITETCMTNLHAEKLTDEADQALYYAKDQGRDRICIYDPDIMSSSHGKILEIILLADNPLIRAMLIKQVAEQCSLSHYLIRPRTFRHKSEFSDTRVYRPERRYLFLIDGDTINIDCLQTIKQLRSVYPAERLFISVLFERSAGAQVAAALEHGADDYLLKPFKSEDLTRHISRLMTH
ncbi:diguanylate cyclase [Planococcus lenghuensis]|uniref:Diguanylate cyclase n=1 Tax=Planococcus lenghuensis TaxID=2213202 RepID=A0A1Q2KVA4_9BACL|nr:diguanylate cyclase [Planococcus lenghuensis]AQQ52056.1 hypothetical protein B0X71_02240 [Planococcus lenghuensis]